MINVIKFRLIFILLFKLVLIGGSFYGAYLLRFDFTIPAQFSVHLFELLPWVLLIKMTVFWFMDLHQGWWRYVAMVDLIQIFKANLIASIGVLLYVIFIHGIAGIPRSILILDWLLCFSIAAGVRFLTRAVRENYFPFSFSTEPALETRTLIIGAGSAGQAIIREIRQNPTLKKMVIGFIDDDKSKLKRTVQGIPVLGGREDIARICTREQIEELIIAIPSLSGRVLREIVKHCEESGVRFRTLPGVGDLIDGKVSISQVRDVDLADLLGREQVQLDLGKIAQLVKGKRILVTGAAGSIGSEICRQVSKFAPQHITLLDHAESPLFQIERELHGCPDNCPVVAVVADIRDAARLEEVFSAYRPEVVFHAAAYKHVPMMEHNPVEAVTNNVQGTRLVADLANRFAVEVFVMISTDKAVNPSSVMGATKRAAELYVQNFSRFSQTRYVTVRFGNVLGSAGSVVPIFKEQIAKGGPVTVTHPDIIRYFMTIPEAVQLVLQAASMGQGGEIFLLDMGEQVKIVHLAEELIKLSGKRPYDDIDIVFTGLRPGEKLYEELLIKGEGVKPTEHIKIKVAAATECDWQWLTEQLDLLCSEPAGAASEVAGKLRKIVPEYHAASH